MSEDISAATLRSPGGRRIVEEIDRRVRTGELAKGARLPSLRELAAEHGVACGTAREALRLLEERDLVVRRHGSGTYVTYSAEQASLGKSVHLMLRSREHVYSHLYACLVEHLHSEGYLSVNIRYASVKDGSLLAATIGWWKEQPPRALVVQVNRSDAVAEIRKHVPSATRVIATFSPPDILPPEWSMVTVDSVQQHVVAARRLIEAGHRRLGLVTREIRPVGIGTDRQLAVQDRFQHRTIVRALNRLLRDAGGLEPVNVHLNRHVQDTGGCDPLHEANLQRLEEYLRSPNAPTAFIGQDNRMIAVQRLASKLGRTVGKDISLVGLGNTPWAEAGDLTSVSVREELVAARISELVAMADQQTEHTVRRVHVTPVLVERSSVGSPPAR